MTKINLLPWRETHRKEKNQEFYTNLGIAAVVAAAIGFGGYKYAEDKVNFQDSRNARLDKEILQLQKELKEIEELEETKNNLLARMEIIQELQGQRPQIVHAFQEIAMGLPDGVYLTELGQEAEKQMVLKGRAESNARVSALMRRLDSSEYFSGPRLEVIEVSESDKIDGISSFKLRLTQEVPKPEKEETNGL